MFHSIEFYLNQLLLALYEALYPEASKRDKTYITTIFKSLALIFEEVTCIVW